MVFPPGAAPTDLASPQFQEFNESTMRSLPAYHLLADSEDVIRSQYRSSAANRRFFGTLVYDGQVYDHIQFKVRGQNSTYVTGKNKWKFFFNVGHEFRARDDLGQLWKHPVRQLNVGTAASLGRAQTADSAGWTKRLHSGSLT